MRITPQVCQELMRRAGGAGTCGIAIEDIRPENSGSEPDLVFAYAKTRSGSDPEFSGLMSSIAIPHVPAPPARRMSSWQTWGVILIAPYALVFLAFVLYPVTYGLWLARHPESYVKLFADPIFLRTVVNTIFFLLIAVNLKFLLALWLSGYFVHERTWIRWL